MEQFASRSRDDGGRYTPGGAVAGVDDHAAAQSLRKRRVQKGVAGAAVVAAGAGLALKSPGMRHVGQRIIRNAVKK